MTFVAKSSNSGFSELLNVLPFPLWPSLQSCSSQTMFKNDTFFMAFISYTRRNN